MNRRLAPFWFAVTFAGAPVATVAPCSGGVDDVPAELQGIDIIEHLDSKLPLDLQFACDTGEIVKLGDLFTGRPIILVPNYYRCPSLCSITLNGLVNGASQIPWSAGVDFDIVAFSINPEEPWQLARAKRDGYVIDYSDKSKKESFDRGERGGWSFLADHEGNARKLGEAVGFNYRLVPESGEYSHAACLVLCTPDGRISRYLYGSYYPINDLKLALVEAGEGKVGSAFDRFLLWCHKYDPSSKSYVKSAIKIMQLGGAATVLAIATGLCLLWFTPLGSRHHGTRIESESEFAPEGSTT